MEKLLLKPSEVADCLGLGRPKTYELLRDGTLPSIRLGHAVRVPTSALREWIERQAAATEEPSM